MADVLKITNHVQIPLSDIEFTAIRAQGPGGQAVNKTSSAVHLRFDYKNSEHLSEAQKARITRFRDNNITDSGFIIIKAQNHRVQERNREDGLKRMTALITKAIYVAPYRKPTRPTLGSQKRRLKKKSERGETKKLRGKVRRIDD